MENGAFPSIKQAANIRGDQASMITQASLLFTEGPHPLFICRP